MATIISLVQGAIILLGFITLALVGLKSMAKDNPSLCNMMEMVQGLLIKLAGIALVGFVMLETYQNSAGTLSVKTIGLYVACAGILVSLMKDVGVKSRFVSDLQTVVASKAKDFQSSVAAQADQARKADDTESHRPA